MVLQSLLFLIGTGAVAATAASAAALLFRGREPHRRALAAVAGFSVVVVLLLLTLGTARLLYPWWAAAAAAVVGTLVVLAAWRARGGPVPQAEGDIPADAPAQERLGLTIALVLLAAFGLGLVKRACIDGTMLAWDDLWYHAPPPTLWLLNGRFVLPPLDLHAYYPFNGELLALWFMLPFRHDAMTSLCGLYWVTLAIVGGIALARGMSCRWSACLLLGALFVASPPILRNARTFAATDLAGMASVLAAIALALPSSGQPRLRERIADASYAGLMAGMALGCRVALAPVPVILFLFLLVVQRAEVPLRKRLVLVAAFSLCVLATGTFWYWRNLLMTGNPVFPAAIGPFEGPWTSDQQFRTTLASLLLEPSKHRAELVLLLKTYIRWPAPVLVLSMVGYLGALVAQIRRDGDIAGRRAQALVLIIGVTLWALFAWTPLSSGRWSPEVPAFPHWRFILVPVVCGLVLFAPRMGGARRGWAWFALCVFAFVPAWRGQSGGTVNFAAAGGVLLAVHAVQRGRIPLWVRRGAAYLALPAALVLLGLWSPWAKARVDERLSVWQSTGYRFGPSWRFADGLPDGSRVTVFGRTHCPLPYYLWYPLFGRRFQLEPCLLLPDGSAYEPLHVRWLRAPDTVPELLLYRDPDVSHLMENLSANRVEYVLLTDGGGPDAKWPPQREALQRSEGARVIYHDDHTEIWQLEQPEAPRGGTPQPDPRGAGAESHRADPSRQDRSATRK